MKRETVSKIVVLGLVILISILFMSMVWNFLMALFLAAITAAMLYPIYLRLLRFFRDRKILASTTTILLFLIVIILPLGGLMGIITTQAINVGESVTPWIKTNLTQTENLSGLLEKLPLSEYIIEYQDEILQKVGELIGSLSRFLLDSLSSVTLMTVNFIFSTFIFLYTLFFFLMDGEEILRKILYYLPLEDQEEHLLLHKFTSVTRATLKGTAVIGIIQGGLAGIAFAVVGINSAVFWGTIMTVLSIIPGIGTGLVWVPASIVLIAGGSTAKGIGLAIFCAVIVGSADNVLRPRLVGKDTEMHELLIFFGTLGGLVLFGMVGVIIGPIISALFVTTWEIYGKVFKDMLPEVGPIVESIRIKKSPKEKNKKKNSSLEND